MNTPMNRLEVIDPSLNSRIKSSSTNIAVEMVSNIISSSIREARIDSINIIISYGMTIEDGPPFIMGCSQHMVDDLDRKYFDFRDSGNSDQASAYFIAARLVSSCVFLTNFKSSDDLCEATYEAIAAKE